MKFEEKLIKLRKENAFSQEELGEKLNVTRQTISKWELGQTKPDSEKIMEIARLFNVSTDDLLNESDDIVNIKETNKEDNKNKRNTIIVIGLIVLLLVIIIWVVGTMFNKASEISNEVIESNNELIENNNGILGNIFGVFNKTFGIINKAYDEVTENSDKATQQIDENYLEMYNNVTQQMNNDYNKDVHNNKYQIHAGVQEKIFLENVINQAIKDNSNGSKKVIVIYNGVTYTDSGELASLISGLPNKQYLITYGYDGEGYINEVIIADV